MARIATLSALAALAWAGAAAAQNPAEIDRVRGGADCRGCNLFQADFAYQSIRNVDVSGSRLRQSDLTASVMDGTNFSNTDLSVAEAYGGRFTRANFSGADLTDSSWVGAYLGYADFTGAQLDGAVLAGANLEGAHGLTQSQLNRACGDAKTVLPAGLHIPACG